MSGVPGSQNKIEFIAIIPARFASTRLPGKPLADIHGKPMIFHVVKQAQKSGAVRVIVATDQADVAIVAQTAGAETALTRADHRSGTERLSEVVDLLDIEDDKVVVNVQGDEPYIEPGLITRVAVDLSLHGTDMATLATPIHDATEAANPNIVKVVVDVDGNALYFSRATIPWDRDRGGFGGTNQAMLRHIGLYAYRAGFLRLYPTMQHTFLEQVEKLELRLLYYRAKIHVSIAESALSLGVDTEEDLERIRNMMPRNLE
ncbi:3-deoxy-D-manno-octulosonate cytidylyltransferase [Penicillium angulare]|uniref:3-deoxy-D-manno-octulosonate cytidylyltransferase n=1 Tax=Penicillium angulare TaxID=116970 RepID=UPI0025406AF8|nr:3-deoxy-D-manno-octulosonate cytidylyltransferase [Penicillium angulare]KAJ5267889.1 3-deoxy-D-manno-octulosonate cytidylyltransferase [Penicillium angulare]